MASTQNTTPKSTVSWHIGVIVATLFSLNACMSSAPNQSTEHARYKPKAIHRPISPAPLPSGMPIRGHVAYATSTQMLRDMPRRPIRNTEKYGEITTNPVHEVSQSPVSTFSIDVDTGSYSNVRRLLNDGRLPPVNAVRVEELINYFPYQYAKPKSFQHPFAVDTEMAQSPWKKDARLLKIGIQAVNKSLGSLPPANLVFLIDVSGSMNSPQKLPLVKKTLRILTKQLRAQDRVTVITYASGEKLVLPTTKGSKKRTILQAINKLQARGATAGESAIQMAYREAQKSFIKNGINRIFLATDGDFNVGVTDFATLKGMVAEKRKSGISLTTLGFGGGNYNEHLMEQMADAGDGNYSYIDNEKEAKKVLRQQLTSTLATVAKDVKIQVEFNPNTVSQYRLIGYENRLLKKEDFNNDNVDAGDIGAGHSVTAIYEIIPTGKTGWLEPSRYQAKPKAATQHGNEYAYVKIRYKKPKYTNSTLLTVPVRTQANKTLALASQDMRFATAVASYGQLLRGGKHTGNFTWTDTIQLAKKAKGKDPFGLREEFIELAETAQSLSSNKPSGEK